MVALVQQQVVSRGWMDNSAVMEFVAVAESTPGPIAVNMATFVGARMGGLAGSLCATVGVVLPSFVVILLVARCYQAFRRSKYVQGVLSGLKPAVVGLIATAVLTMGSAAFAGSTWFWVVVTVALLALAIRCKKLHPIAIIGISALVGIAAGYLGL